MTDKAQAQSAATKRPWKVFTTKDGLKVVGIGQSETGDGICDSGFGVWSWMHADGIANAALIVTAVNERDALLARVEELEAALRIFLGEDDRFIVSVAGNPNVVNAMLEHARAALSGERP